MKITKSLIKKLVIEATEETFASQKRMQIVNAMRRGKDIFVIVQGRWFYVDPTEFEEADNEGVFVTNDDGDPRWIDFREIDDVDVTG